jgi:catechol 2,3-dioxygenase-like lactoylglutathione lyase family enzyme
MIKDSNVTVIVSDMKKAIHFYVETLGLELKANYGDQYAEIHAPGVMIGLHPASTAGPKPGKSESLSIGFVVENLNSAMSELKSKGVSFSRVVEDRPTKLAFFADPDGNPLYLSEIRRWGYQGGAPLLRGNRFCLLSRYYHEVVGGTAWKTGK